MTNGLKFRHIAQAAFVSLAVFACQKPDIDDPAPGEGPDVPVVEPAAPAIVFEEGSITAPIEGGTFTFQFSANRRVSVAVSEEWCNAMVSARVEENDGGAAVEENDRGAAEAPAFDKYDLIVTVQPFSGDTDRTATVTLSAPECESRVLTIVQERVRSAANNLSSLVLKASVNGLDKDVTFNWDETSGTFSAMYLKWISKSEPQMLVPEFVTDGESVSVDGKEVISGETAISFADDFDLVVRAENGDEKSYRVTFNCPQINTELPVMRIALPASSITSKETYRKTAFELYRPGTDEGSWFSDTRGEVEIRGRGNSTWGLPKKPYRIKFPEKFSPIGLNHAKAKSWVILAHDMDKSLIRNHLAFELSRILFGSNDGWHDEAALDFTPCSQFVNVYMGDEFHGVYQMSDQMEVAKGRINLDKLVAADGSDETKITGGHLIETNIHHDEGYPVSFTSSRGIYMDHKYPKDDDMDIAQYRYMENFVKNAEAALYSSNFTDRTDGWRKWFDEKTLADFIIVKEFAGDMDGYTSTYFYKRRGVDKIFFGPVWDLDKGWNNDRRTPHGNTLTQLMIYGGFYMPPYINPDWFHRFWQDAEFRKFVGERWAAKKDELKAKVLSELDAKPKEMSKAIEANFSVWEFYYQYSDEANMPARTYELEIERMRQLTEQRAALLDKLFR